MAARGESAERESRPFPERLLIVRILHTLPAAIALRQAYPRAILGWLIEERWADLLSGLETVNSQSGAKQPRLVDALHVVNTKKWRKRPLDGSVWKQIKGSLEGLRRMHYQVAVDFQGLLRDRAKYVVSRGRRPSELGRARL